MATMKGKLRISGHAHPPRPLRRNAMNRFYASCVIAAVAALGSWTSIAPANAAPPTVTPSPGYDARLQEQRAAQTIYEPVAPAVRPLKPVSRRPVKHIHHNAY
jgi:hypothetical protein